MATLVASSEVRHFAGQRLVSNQEDASHVYFQAAAITISLLYVGNGSSAEIAVVGHEGVVGMLSWAANRPSRAVVTCLPGAISFQRVGL
jgi:hypothetical protein